MSDLEQVMILDLDVGNTRIKWRLTENGQQSHGFFQAQNGGLSRGIKSFNTAPHRVRLSSVVHGELLQQLQQLCLSHWQVNVELAKVEGHCAGVTQAYINKEKLGVDRWLGMLAAYQQVGDCIYVSCGSAITVDVLMHGGQHQGGYIVPGLSMMLNSLYQGTDAVKVEGFEGVADLLPGRSTEAAVNKGILAMVKGLVEQASKLYLSEAGSEPKILITGGDGETVQQFLSAETIYNPYLVLDGLALALP